MSRKGGRKEVMDIEMSTGVSTLISLFVFKPSPFLSGYVLTENVVIGITFCHIATLTFKDFYWDTTC